MINEKVLSEKLKYLINMNGNNQFEIRDIYIDFEYADSEREKLISYDIDVRFDYIGSIDAQFEDFLFDINRMQEKMKVILNKYTITEEGKLIAGEKSKSFSIEPIILDITYEVDTKHIFNLGYKFLYEQD